MDEGYSGLRSFRSRWKGSRCIWMGGSGVMIRGGFLASLL